MAAGTQKACLSFGGVKLDLIRVAPVGNHFRAQVQPGDHRLLFTQDLFVAATAICLYLAIIVLWSETRIPGIC